LGDKVSPVATTAGIESSHNVRVLQSGKDFDFALEPLITFGLPVRRRDMQKLDGDPALHGAVHRSVDPAHAASAQFPLHNVLANFRRRVLIALLAFSPNGFQLRTENWAVGFESLCEEFVDARVVACSQRLLKSIANVIDFEQTLNRDVVQGRWAHRWPSRS